MTRNGINRLIAEWVAVERNPRVNKFTRQAARSIIRELQGKRNRL